MKLKRLASVLLALTMVVGMTACGGGGDTADGSGDDAASTEDSDGKTTLTMWSWSPITRTCDKMLAAFEEENPDIDIEFTYYNYDPEYLSALSAAAASDSLPDIIGLQPGSLTAQYADYLVDYTSYAEEEWGESWKDNYPEMIANQIQMGNAEGDEGNYILPVEAQVITIVYNKNVFDEYKLEVPTTYDELKEVCKTLNDNGVAPLFFGGANGWQCVNVFTMLCSQLDTTMFDKAQAGEIKWTDEKMVEAMSNFKLMFDDGIFQTGAMSADANTNGTPAFVSNSAAMMALGSWWCQEYTAEDPATTVADWDFGFFYLPPVGTAANAATPVGGIDFGYGITTNCENPEAAWTAIKSFSSGAGIQACVDDVNNLPAFKGIEPKNEELNETLVEQYNGFSEDLNEAMNQRIGEPTIETALQNALAGVGSGELTPEEGCQAVQDAQDAL
ncbi:ABC transporter substrate-binding protein [Luxibacter massiliensis]|uniref:ABC transporter substrate-binding protein n=1 Tax=Luxibacter massiliensis TaxID=2219695 RepID=UPI000F04BF66|nr:extracellular solute-binding protein [Luxibacter massiliensis]